MNGIQFILREGTKKVHIFNKPCVMCILPLSKEYFKIVPSYIINLMK